VRPQSSKVSFPGPATIHPNPSRGAAHAVLRSARTASLAVLASLAPAWPAAAAPPGKATVTRPCLYDSASDPILLAGMSRVHAMDYAGADSAFSSLPAGSPGRAYFRGLALFHRFHDRGDTAALFRAESLWTEVSRRAASRDATDPVDTAVNIDLYRGLSTLQLSYVASIVGSGVRAAHLGRKAAQQLRPQEAKAEAAAALALYDYYKAALLKGVAWLPFVKADAGAPLRRLEAAVEASRYLRETLETSLLWLYYDAGRYEEGLRRVDAFLSRHPGNRTWRQMRADFLFRRGDLAEARALHESLLEEYSGLMEQCPPPRCLPLGYLSSVGNLAKIHGKTGSAELRRKYVALWSSSRFSPYLSWMPGSLRREVDALGE
jgi:hypothetical protein